MSTLVAELGTGKPLKIRYRIGRGLEEADQSLVELVRFWIIEISHQVGDGHLEVLGRSLARECGS